MCERSKGEEMLQAPEQRTPAAHGSPCEADTHLQHVEDPALEELDAQRQF